MHRSEESLELELYYSKVLDEDKGVRFNSVILNNIWIETGLGFL